MPLGERTYHLEVSGAKLHPLHTSWHLFGLLVLQLCQFEISGALKQLSLQCLAFQRLLGTPCPVWRLCSSIWALSEVMPSLRTLWWTSWRSVQTLGSFRLPWLSWGWTLLYSFYFIRINLYSLTSNIMSQESCPAFEELTLFRLAIKLLFLQYLEHSLK